MLHTEQQDSAIFIGSVPPKLSSFSPFPHTQVTDKTESAINKLLFLAPKYLISRPSLCIGVFFHRVRGRWDYVYACTHSQAS